jgi:hypothetical protein
MREQKYTDAIATSDAVGFPEANVVSIDLRFRSPLPCVLLILDSTSALEVRVTSGPRSSLALTGQTR